MHRYSITKRLGDGTYGEVVRASNKQTGEMVRPPLPFVGHSSARDKVRDFA
jgi:serine/threonine protein kinase